MSIQLLTVSPSPHVHSEVKASSLMYGVIMALLPATLMSFYVFGISAVIVMLIAVVSCVAFEFLIARYLLNRTATVTDGSAIITGLLLAFNLPGNIPWWAIAVGSMVAIGIGKMAFGGLGNNPFNPALVARVFLLISFPVPMTSWPKPGATWQVTDATTGATPLGMVKEALMNGQPLSEITGQLPSYFQFFVGSQGGSLGEVSGLALLVGFVYMLYKKIITWHTPVSMLVAIFAISGVMWLIDPNQYMDPVFHLLTGGVLLGAFFMATDYVTSPMTHKGMLIYGAGIGVITILIRLWGAYPEGVSFAILIMNAVVPLINKYVKPRRFGIQHHE